MGWNIQLPEAEYYHIQSPSLDGLVREIQDNRTIAIDTETDGLSIVHCRPYYWSISWNSSNGRDRRVTLNADTFPAFKYIFNDYERSWALVNAKFDAHMFANAGFQLRGKLVDVSVMHALLYEEEPHGLKDMTASLFGWKWSDFTNTFGSVRSNTCACGGTKASHGPDGNWCKRTGCMEYRQITSLDVLRRAEKDNPDLLVDYAANDAYATWKLKQLLDKELEDALTHSLYPDTWPGIKSMHDYFYQTEVPFTRVLYRCERNGLKVDRGYLEKISPEIIKSLEQLRFKINGLTGRMMKTAGPDLAKYFIDECRLTPHKMTKGGKSGVKKPSIDTKYLTYVAEEYPDEDFGKVAAFLVEHGAISKQYSTYIEKMPGRLDSNDCVHSRLNQDVARTGRLSSSDPNMQNVTTGEKDRFHLRNAFICEADEDMVVADYSQLEMRLLAAAAQEPAMMEIFHKNWDIHTGNAVLMYNIPYEEIVEATAISKQVKKGKLPETALTARVWECLNARSDVKNIGFGLNYGMKAKAMALRMGCTVEEAEKKIERYMATYPAVRAYFDTAIEEVRECGYAFTLLGRRRSLPDIWAKRDYQRFRAERQASNMPIQGTAAEVCKMAMINISEDGELEHKYGFRMRMQVHDEIIGTCPKEYTEIVKARINEWMAHPFPTDIGVPLLADVGSGPSWGAAK